MQLDALIYGDLTRNASIFLNFAVENINKGLAEYPNKLGAIVNLQMAFELAMKARIVELYGIRHVLKKVSDSATNEDLLEQYRKNSLWIKEFDTLKNYMKAKNMVDFDREKYKHIEQFQTYRNKLVHWNYCFTPEENSEIEHSILYTLVHLLGRLMNSDVAFEDIPSVKDYIDAKQYQALMSNQKYVDVLTDYIDNVCNTPRYYCLTCSENYLTLDGFCHNCLTDYRHTTNAFGHINCKFCRTRSSVIYDRLNLRLNDWFARGMCVNCKQDTIIYQCPICSIAYDTEGIGRYCTPRNCINSNEYVFD